MRDALISRRSFLKVLGLGTAAVTLAACSEEVPASSTVKKDPVFPVTFDTNPANNIGVVDGGSSGGVVYPANVAPPFEGLEIVCQGAQVDSLAETASYANYELATVFFMVVNESSQKINVVNALSIYESETEEFYSALDEALNPPEKGESVDVGPVLENYVQEILLSSRQSPCFAAACGSKALQTVCYGPDDSADMRMMVLAPKGWTSLILQVKPFGAGGKYANFELSREKDTWIDN